MREKMSEQGRVGASITNNGVRSNDHTPSKPASTRAELAKIAGTSQGSIQRTKYILDNGTPEQIKRAEKGGKGNTISAIANEIKESKNKSNTSPF